MNSDPIYQIGIFGLDTAEKLHEYKSYNLPVEDTELTFTRVNGSVEKVTGSIKKITYTKDDQPNDNVVPVNIYIQIEHQAKMPK